MASERRDLPPTMPSPETGETMTRAVRRFVVRYRGQSMEVDLPGYYPEGDGESIHIGDDLKASDEALRLLKQKVDGLPAPRTIQKLRKKLKLSQREAGLLFKVGEKAFDKYERGLVEPSGPTVQLLKLLDKHPKLVDDLR